GGTGGASGGTGGASGGSGGGTGGNPPILVNCGGVNCDVANGKQCCYDSGTTTGVCQTAGASCTSAAGSTKSVCDQKADCPSGQFCCLKYFDGTLNPDKDVSCQAICPYFISRGSSTQVVCSITADCPSGLGCKATALTIPPAYKTCQP
ncbi:MAG TPA: hypothetical protein PKA88_28410, partial [Polyangiaceae bacterium]|nr:hypothetical protein [Polyangiaceae bacterium]